MDDCAFGEWFEENRQSEELIDRYQSCMHDLRSLGVEVLTPDFREWMRDLWEKEEEILYAAPTSGMAAQVGGPGAAGSPQGSLGREVAHRVHGGVIGEPGERLPPGGPKDSHEGARALGVEGRSEE